MRAGRLPERGLSQEPPLADWLRRNQLLLALDELGCWDYNRDLVQEPLQSPAQGYFHLCVNQCLRLNLAESVLSLLRKKPPEAEDSDREDCSLVLHLCAVLVKELRGRIGTMLLLLAYIFSKG